MRQLICSSSTSTATSIGSAPAAAPVPAIVDQETWDRAQAQLARNAALSFRNNTKHNYLLRCLMTCATCGLAMFGRYAARGKQPERRYYQCHGKDCLLSA